MSQELYDSDNPDCPLNAYHVESKPRLIALEDFDDSGKPVRLTVDFMEIPSSQDDQKKGQKKQKG